VITGRASDPALFLATMIHAFGWAMDDWNLLGQGTVAGHLLECAGQITGGYFADPGYKDVPDLARLGFPIGEVGEDGSLIVTKVAGSGGAVTAQTCKEQLLYEVHNPHAYYSPDVVLDMGTLNFDDQGNDSVRITGAGRLEDFRERVRWLMVRDADAEDYSEHHAEGSLEYRFAPKKGIPFPAFTAASRDFPELRVEAEWDHEGVRGCAVIENGRLVEQENAEPGAAGVRAWRKPGASRPAEMIDDIAKSAHVVLTGSAD